MKELNETSQNLKVSTENRYMFDPIKQLDLKVQNNPNSEDYKEVMTILTGILSYPCNELAEFHMESNRLGLEDLRSEILERTNKDGKASDVNDNIEYCSCCGFVHQKESLKICTHLGEINNIGISTYLYFQTIKNLVILLVLLSLGYSIFALATNVKASDEYRKLIETGGSINVKFLSTISYVALSLGSKQLNPTTENKTYYFIQCWIGLGITVVWLIMFFILKYSEQGQETKVEEETISASDFTITMENVPKDITKEELQENFKRYEESITNVPAHMKVPLTIAKINVGTPFYLNKEDFKDEALDELREKHEKLIETFIKWIEERQDSHTFSTTKEERQKTYTEFSETMKKIVERYTAIGEQLKKKIKEETKQEVTTIFVTFQSSHAMKMVANLNDPSIASKIRYYLTCCQGHNKFRVLRGQEVIKVKIQRAPEPEDVLWTNLAVPTGEYVKRKIITYSVTFILLGISFAIVYGLSKAQQSNTENQILSLVISVTISVINIIIAKIIQKLSAYQMEYTTTKYQTSLAMKSIFAALINSILIPIIVNFYIKEDVYGKNGLASDVFMLGLTNSFVSPILKLIDISYIVNRIMKALASRASSRLSSNQVNLNNAFEYMIFEVGQEYVYLVSLYLFTCFFVSLQPIVAFFAFAGMGLMYWTQKYSLFNKMQRPVPGTNLVNVTMFQLILLGGFVYSMGSLTWSNFMPGGIPKEALLPNLIALGVSILTFLLPYRAVLALCQDEIPGANMKFNDKRIILTSEYDRLNPTTSSDALKEFQEYSKKRFENASEDQKKKMAEQFMRQNARGQQKPQMNLNPFGSMFQPAGPAYLPPPQMMFGGGPPPMFMAPQYGMRPQGYGFQPMQPGFQQPGFQQPGFQQIQVQPPGFQPMNNNFRPVAPMPGPTFVPNSQPPGFGGPAYRPPAQNGFGFQPQQQSGFGFQQPMQMNMGGGGFGFQAPGINLGFQGPNQMNLGFGNGFGFN